MKCLFLAAYLVLFSFLAQAKITVGSKTFTESYILAEIVAQTIEGAGEVEVERKLGLGNTGIIFEALNSSQIDIYPEYTGTISESILKNPELRTRDEINRALSERHLMLSQGLGFEDTYALAVRESFANENKIEKISDLKKFSEIRAGFTHEFLKRADGFEGLVGAYNLKFKNYKGMEHSLAYQSLEEGRLDLIEIYSTDSKIQKYNLRILKDDLKYFPNYTAVLLMKTNLPEKFPKTMAALKKLEGSIDEAKMIELNAKVEIEKWNFAETASYFLKRVGSQDNSLSRMFWRRTLEHLSLVFSSLAIAIILGIPLGILAARVSALAQVVLVLSSVLQTIPSLALLCFLIPVFGIGYLPAVVALFLYALLPIVRNTYLGFKGIDSKLIESAKSLGLTSWDRFLKVEFPLASPSILSGIKLSAVINVGTATLAAFIGAGGYGAIIVTGLALNDTQLILQGAVPSAILALLVHGIFELADFLFIPRGLKI